MFESWNPICLILESWLPSLLMKTLTSSCCPNQQEWPLTIHYHRSACHSQSIRQVGRWIETNPWPPASLIFLFRAFQSNSINIFVIFFLGVFKAQTVFAFVAAWLFIDIISGMKELTESEGSRYLQCYQYSLFAVLYNELQAGRPSRESVCECVCLV